MNEHPAKAIYLPDCSDCLAGLYNYNGNLTSDMFLFPETPEVQHNEL